MGGSISSQASAGVAFMFTEKDKPLHLGKKEKILELGGVTIEGNTLSAQQFHCRLGGQFLPL
jgi:hypothetical protein